ncbi:hypothetical protein ONA91_26375 [Micromonospora sp. DR5-3]|uniref:hypothetical protein n=1 Tax=unclassified Micromonospora TaxID=2617518 RepID=UPI0011D517C2|nr:MULTISPECIES: hypothetical protein [unclassified Micromonospora]MCW3817981.1 hypothetical protein [Micromonospora sp. DR5-3]TYC19058.1 hypothetical protein FXF52_38650 [Micromonospora sp. MP36]
MTGLLSDLEVKTCWQPAEWARHATPEQLLHGHCRRARWVVQLRHGTITFVDPDEGDGLPGCHVQVWLPVRTTG